MDPKFKPYRMGMLTVKEKYVCGREDQGRGRSPVPFGPGLAVSAGGFREDAFGAWDKTIDVEEGELP